MANLIGSGINQISVNGMLGNLAFQDKAYVSIDKVGIGSTFVDSGTSNQILQVYGGGAYISGNLGVGATNPTSLLSVQGNSTFSGVATFTAANSPSVVLRSGASASYTTLDIGRTSTEGIFAVVSAGTQFATDSSVGDIVIRNNNATGKILFVRGASNSSLAIDGSNVLVGTSSSTGTASQPLQVSGGAYISGNLGIGTTNPTSKLTVSGNIFSTGVITATSFSGSGTNLTGIVTSITAGSGISVDSSTGNVTITATAVGGGSSLTVYDGYPNLIGVVTSIDFGSNLTVTSLSAGIATVNATGGGGTNYWDSTSVGIHTLSNVGIGTTNPTSKLTVTGDVLVSGILTASSGNFSGIVTSSGLSISGVTTLGIVTSGNIFSTGIITAVSGFNAVTGGDYEINNVSVLTSTTLGSGVVNSSLTSVGTLSRLNVSGVSTLGIVTSGNIFSTGIITATSFSGSGTNLTGIVTFITAGSGISVNSSTGNVTVSAVGLGIRSDAQTIVGSGITTLDFTGPGIATVTAGSGIATITVASEDVFIVPLSDETSNIGIATSAISFRAPFPMRIVSIPRANVSTAATQGRVVVDVKVAGTTILGANKIGIDTNATTSTTAAVQTTLATNPTTIADDALITFDITGIGTGAKGLKVNLLYYKNSN